MYKKFTSLVLAVAALVIFLPSSGSAVTPSSEKSASVSEYSANSGSLPQRRMRNRRWNRNRRMNNRRVRVIRQVFYRNGRKYVRYIRVYR